MMMMMMKSSLLGVFLLLLLSGAASDLGSVVKRYYGYINHYRTWTEAQHYCRSSTYYADLATIFEQSDESQITMTQYHAWIGLYKHTPVSGSPSWAWSNGKSYGYNLTSLWIPGHPHSSHGCATIYHTNRKLYGHNCGAYFFFFCHKEREGHNDYIFIPKSKSWSEAQQYCRELSNYDDLASLWHSRDIYIASQHHFPVWTGLHKEDGAMRWSTGQSDYRNWAGNEPRDNGDCVSIYSTSKQMATQDCSARLPFVCFRHNLILVNENKTWEEALEHCRASGHELLSVQPAEDHDFVMNKVLQAETEEVWTGLRFLGHQWLFVNGATVSYPDLPPCPPEGQRCGALSKNSTGSMETLDCAEKRNFLCYS